MIMYNNYSYNNTQDKYDNYDHVHKLSYVLYNCTIQNIDAQFFSSGYGGLHATLPHDLRNNGASPGWGGVEPHRKIVLHTTNYCNICVYIYAYIDLYLTIYLYYAIIYIGLYRNHSKNDLVSLLCIIVWAAQTSVAIEYI